VMCQIYLFFLNLQTFLCILSKILTFRRLFPQKLNII